MAEAFPRLFTIGIRARSPAADRPEEMADALGEAAPHPVLREELAARAHAEVKRRFSGDGMRGMAAGIQ